MLARNKEGVYWFIDLYIEMFISTITVISDNNFSTTVVSNKDLGHVLFKHLTVTLSFIRFHSQPQQLQPRRLIHYTFASGHCPEPPRVGSRCTGVLRFASTPSLESGNIRCRELSKVVLCDFLWCPKRPSPCGQDTSASSSVTKIPATSTSHFFEPPARRSIEGS